MTDVRLDTFLVVAFTKLFDKLVGIGAPQRLFNLCIRCIRFAQPDVLLDRHVEKDGLLTNVSDLVAQVSKLNIFQWNVVDKYTTFAAIIFLGLVRVIEPLNQLYHSALPGARWSNDSRSLANLERVSEVSEHDLLFPGGVAEVDMFEANFAIHIELSRIFAINLNRSLSLDH